MENEIKYLSKNDKGESVDSLTGQKFYNSCKNIEQYFVIINGEKVVLNLSIQAPYGNIQYPVVKGSYYQYLINVKGRTYIKNDTSITVLREKLKKTLLELGFKDTVGLQIGEEFSFGDKEQFSENQEFYLISGINILLLNSLENLKKGYINDLDIPKYREFLKENKDIKIINNNFIILKNERFDENYNKLLNYNVNLSIEKGKQEDKEFYEKTPKNILKLLKLTGVPIDYRVNYKMETKKNYTLIVFYTYKYFIFVYNEKNKEMISLGSYDNDILDISLYKYPSDFFTSITGTQLLTVTLGNSFSITYFNEDFDYEYGQKFIIRQTEYYNGNRDPFSRYYPSLLSSITNSEGHYELNIGKKGLPDGYLSSNYEGFFNDKIIKEFKYSIPFSPGNHPAGTESLYITEQGEVFGKNNTGFYNYFQF